MSNNRAEQLIRRLDELTLELKFLAGDPGAFACIKELRVHLGFDGGGYVGHTSLSDLVEEERFGGDDDDCEDDD